MIRMRGEGRRMTRFTEGELVEMDKNLREVFYDSRLKNPYCLRVLIDMARATLNPEISEKEILDHSWRFEKRFWSPAPAWQAGARWAVERMRGMR